MKSRKNSKKKSRLHTSRQARRRRILQLENLEDRVVMDGSGVFMMGDFAENDANAFGGAIEFQGEINHSGPIAVNDEGDGGAGDGPASSPQGSGAHGADGLTIVLDFNDPGQANTTDIFGNTVSTFDVTAYGFTQAEFDLVAQSVLQQVETHFYEPPTAPTTNIPQFHQLDIDFVIGDVGTAPAGITEYYYVQIGEKTGNQTFLGVAGLSVVRDANGNGPNGVQIGDVVATVLTDNINGLGGVGNALTSGDLTATTNAIAGTTSHEVGHTVSLLHLNKAGSVTPDGSPPIMGTGAIDLPNPDRILRREFALSGQNQQAAGATQEHINQLESALGTRLVTRNEVAGNIYLDANENGIREAGEGGIPNIEVFYDLDLNGIHDPTEPFTTSDANGDYSLVGGLGTGTFEVVADIPPGLLAINPSDGTQTVTFTLPIETLTDIDFGVAEDPAQISGFKWIDADLDGRYDSDTEVPGAGFRIYLDVNNNERLDLGEPTTVTDENGLYSISSPGAGTYTVREAIPPGFTLTFPSNGFHTVELAQDESAGNLNFGNSGQLHDFGNAPDSYGTRLADDGARHRLLPNFQMGPTMSGEMDVITSPGDNDGTSFSRMVAGQTGTLDVNVVNGGQSPGYVHAWVDFDQSGTFDVDEKIISNVRRGDGNHSIDFAIPSDAGTGETWARVRYGWEYNLSATGEAFAGEVEDSMVNVVGDEPQAIDDLFEGPNAVDQDSTNNSLDVLANDFASTSGPITVSLVQGVAGPAATTQGGVVSRAVDELSVIYTPPVGFFGSDTFTYTITDPLGNTSTAVVEVVVTPTIAGPIALDDVHFFPDFGLNPSTDIPVLQNDFVGPNDPIRINQVTQQGNFGTAVVNGDFLTYTPTDANSEGQSDIIRYEIIDQANVTSEASVLIQIGDTTGDDAIQITLGAFDPVTGTPINTIQVGGQFELRAFVADIRAPIPPGPNGQDLNGVFSSYFDVSVNKPTSDSLTYAASFLGQPNDTVNYPEAFNGDTLTPGLVNEAGGVQPIQVDGQVQGHGLGPIHIWTQTVRADAAGNLIFQPNPSDDIDLLTTFFDPPDEALVRQISFIPTSLIVTAPGGEAPGGVHNSGMAGDVDGNGRIDARDPLLLINMYVHQRNGEAESAGNEVMWDVVEDGNFRIDDIMAAIGYFRYAHLNRNGGMGEGEFDLMKPIGNPMADQAVADLEPANSIFVGPLQQSNDLQRQTSQLQGEVLQDANEIASVRYADDEAASSIYDRNWKTDLEDSLDDDLLASITSEWKLDD